LKIIDPVDPATPLFTMKNMKGMKKKCPQTKKFFHHEEHEGKRSLILILDPEIKFREKN